MLERLEQPSAEEVEGVLDKAAEQLDILPPPSRSTAEQRAKSFMSNFNLNALALTYENESW